MKKTILTFLFAGSVPGLHAGTIIRANPGGTQNANVPATFGDNVSLDVPGDAVFETYAGADGTVGTPAIDLTWSVTAAPAGAANANNWQFHNWSGAGSANTGGGALQLDGSRTESRFSLAFAPESYAAVILRSFNFVGDTNGDSFQYRVQIVRLSDESVVFAADTAPWTTDTAQNPDNTDPATWAGAPQVVLDFTGDPGAAYRLDLIRIDDDSANPGSRVNIAVDNIDFDQLTSNKKLVWTGAASTEWSTASLAAPKNWVIAGTTTAADFAEADEVRFEGGTSRRTVEVGAEGVHPALTTFDFSGTGYLLRGTGGIGGTGGLVKNGTGTLTIANSNPFRGDTSVQLGTLVVDHETALSGSVVSTIHNASEGRFGSPVATTLGGLGGDGDWVLSNSSSQPVALTLEVASGISASHEGELSGTGSLVKTGEGTQSLGYPGSYTGGTTISGGVLRIDEGAALGEGAIVIAGGQLHFGTGWLIEVANDIALPAASQQTFTVRAAGGGAPAAGTTAVLHGKISGGAAGEVFRLVDSGTGLNHNHTLRLTNEANDFQGTIEMWRGTLAITSDAALGDPDNDITHYTENLSGALRFDADGITLGSARTIDMPGNNNSRPIHTQEFTATIAGPITGTGTLVKQGDGVLILSGEDKTYTGTTRIAAGTLQLDTGLGAAENPVNVDVDGTLSGTGTIARPVQVNGTLSPGATVGALPVDGAVELAPGSFYRWEIDDWEGPAGSGYDTVTAASLSLSATADNPVTISIAPLSSASFRDEEQTFTLISSSGEITGFDPAAFVVDASQLPSAVAYAWSVQVIGNTLALVYGEAAGTPFEQWIAVKGLTGPDASFGADPDGDGIVNGLEFVLGGEPNPAHPAAGSREILPVASTDDTHLVFTFRRSIAAADLATVEYSTGLSGTWTAAGEEVTVTVTAGGNGFELVEARIPKGSATRLFARLTARP